MELRNHIIYTLQKLKPELAAKFGVQSLVLFGSIVRNDFSPEASDVDILVDFKRPIGIEFVDLAEFLEQQIKRKVDLVSKGGVNDKYLQAIEKEIIYVW